MAFSAKELNDQVRRLVVKLVGKDPVRQLAAVTELIAAAEAYRFAAMTAARDAETDWSVIGQAMGITGQAAGRLFRRHGNMDTRPGNRPYPGSRVSAEAS